MNDIDWFLCDPGIRKLYGGQVVIVRARHVWGAGGNLDAALRAARAQAGCPEPAKLKIVVIPDEEDFSFYTFPEIPEASPGTAS